MSSPESSQESQKATNTLNQVHGLTSRQHEVYSLHLEGLTQCQIADRLFIEPVTVKNNLSLARKSLGIRAKRGRPGRWEQR